MTAKDSSAHFKVILNYLADPSVARHIHPRVPLNYEPMNSKLDFWLVPWMVDYSKGAKFGGLCDKREGQCQLGFMLLTLNLNPSRCLRQIPRHGDPADPLCQHPEDRVRSHQGALGSSVQGPC